MNVTINGDVHVHGACCDECNQLNYSTGAPSELGPHVVRGFAEVNAGKTVTLRLGVDVLEVSSTGPVEWTVDIKATGLLLAYGCGRYWHTSIEPAQVDE